MSNDTLQDIKAGDKALLRHYGNARYRYDVVEVARVTTTQIVLTDTTRYRKDTGDEIGKERGRSTWGQHITLIAYDETLIQQQQEETRKMREARYLEDTKWRDMDEETRHAVYELVKNAKKVEA